MLKDIEGKIRSIIGFSKASTMYDAKLEFKCYLKPLDLNWLRKLFNVDPNDPDILVRHLVEREDGFKLNKEQYEALKPYMIGEPVDFSKYDFFFDSGADEDAGWTCKYPSIQVKNAIKKIEPLINHVPKIKSSISSSELIIDQNREKKFAMLLDNNYWNEFYEFIQNEYPFNELSLYRIDWGSVKSYKRLSWNKAIVAPKHVQEFLKNTCVGDFKEIAIAYGPEEPVVLISLECFCYHFIEYFFKDNWGACFIIGAKRDKYGIIKLNYECFVEVTCGDYLTAPKD